jgi:hypothetical protein
VRKRPFILSSAIVITFVLAGAAVRHYRTSLTTQAAPGARSSPGTDSLVSALNRIRGRRTLTQRLAEYGPAARSRLKPLFRAQNLTYPPGRIVLVGLKQERMLEVYAKGAGERYCLVTSYPILAASGNLGPKLREGDCQVPEGIYRVVFLNPNSALHLSLRLNYPNQFDRDMAKKDGRDKLGEDIMIHGGSASIGCLAVGDRAAEDLFVLAADTGMANIKVILSPVDFRKTTLIPAQVSGPAWTDGLYKRIASELAKLPSP